MTSALFMLCLGLFNTSFRVHEPIPVASHDAYETMRVCALRRRLAMGYNPTKKG